MLLAGTRQIIKEIFERLKKVKGTERTKPTCEPKISTDLHISAYCRNCRSGQPSADGSCACLIAIASGGSVAEAKVAGDEADFWTFSSVGNDCDTGSIPDLCDVERIASGKVVQHSSSGENF